MRSTPGAVSRNLRFASSSSNSWSSGNAKAWFRISTVGVDASRPTDCAVKVNSSTFLAQSSRPDQLVRANLCHLLYLAMEWVTQQHPATGGDRMVLATAKIEDFDRFWNTFSTKGAEKRKQHGCKGAHVFQDPNESDRIWAIFDWDQAGWQSFTSDPEVPAIFQEAGFTQGPPKSAEFLREHDA
jgi:quinol monooxygenase YgiN